MATGILVGAAIAVGCRGEKQYGTVGLVGADSTADVVAQVEPTMAKLDSASGALVHYAETDELFENARATFMLKEAAKTNGELRAAAEYFKQLRDSTSGAIQRRISEMHRELDSLATRLDAKKDVSVRQLDHAFARANLVEAECHLERSAAAWTRRDTSTAAEALILTADHLERAALDAGVSLGKAMVTALSDARRLGNDLLLHAPLSSSATMTRVQHDLEESAGALRKRIDNVRP